MTLPFKAIAVDMDGTFLDDHKEFNHTEFDQILTELEKRKIHFIVASGRPYSRLQEDFGVFSQRIDFVSLNGSMLVVNGKIVASYPLQRETALALLEEVSDKYGKVAPMVFESDVTYFHRAIPEAEREFLAYFAGQSAVIDHWRDLPNKDILQITFSLDNSKASEVEAEFNQKHAQKISAFGSAKSAIDTNMYGINKGAGLKHLLAKLNLTGDDLIAFGDGGNDIAMLDFAKYSYAMANGMPIAKEHAKYIAPANTENGVFKVLQDYLEKD